MFLAFERKLFSVTANCDISQEGRMDDIDVERPRQEIEKAIADGDCVNCCE